MHLELKKSFTSGNLFSTASLSICSLTFDAAAHQNLRSTLEYTLATMSYNVWAPSSVAFRIDSSLLLRFLKNKINVLLSSAYSIWSTDRQTLSGFQTSDLSTTAYSYSYLRYPQSMCFGHRLTLPCMGITTFGESSRNLYVDWKYSCKGTEIKELSVND